MSSHVKTREWFGVGQTHTHPSCLRSLFSCLSQYDSRRPATWFHLLHELSREVLTTGWHFYKAHVCFSYTVVNVLSPYPSLLLSNTPPPPFPKGSVTRWKGHGCEEMAHWSRSHICHGDGNDSILKVNVCQGRFDSICNSHN